MEIGMFYCSECGSSDACERTDLVGEPILCDRCYGLEVYGDCDCDRCNNSYYVGDVMHCKVDECDPVYDA